SGDNGFTAGQRFDRGRNSDGRAKLHFAYRLSREFVGPLLLLQIRDGGGIIGRVLVSVSIRGPLIGEHGHRGELMTIAKPRRVDDQGPAIAARGRRRAFDPEGTRPRGISAGPGDW